MLWNWHALSGVALARVCAAGVLVLAVTCRAGFGQSVVPRLEMLPEAIRGIILYPDGKTPVADVPVRLWSVKEDRIIHRSASDDNGAFRIPRTADGECFLFIGRLRVDLRVLSRHGDAMVQQHDMILVMPHRMLVTGGRMYDVLISPVLAAASASSIGEGMDRRPPRPVPPQPELPPEPPPIPPEPPVVSP